MIYMDVDTALSEVPVNIAPLTDDGDFKSIESSVAYNASGMALYWHFVTTAGAYSVTQVTPTTGGAYDWAHQAQGMYSIEIPASGGASINNDTEGFGYFTGFVTGVLPWRGPTICFRAAAINNALVDGGDVLDVSVTELGGDAQSATDLKDFADDGYDPSTNKVQGVVLVDTLTTYTGNTVQTGDSFGRIGLAGAGLTNLPWNASWDTEVQSECADALTAYGPATPAQILTTALTESYPADGATMTVAQALYWIRGLLDELTISGTTGTVKKLDGSTTAGTLTYNDATTPTSVTRSG